MSEIRNNHPEQGNPDPKRQILHVSFYTCNICTIIQIATEVKYLLRDQREGEDLPRSGSGMECRIKRKLEEED